jgi:site-specific DNA-methyltransferase (adenine-specific)
MVPQRYEPFVPLDKLTPHPANPNEGDQSLVAELLEENGFAGAVLAQESTGILIDGETRWRTAGEEGMDGLPVIWLDVSDDERDRFLASWNESGRRGLNNMAKLIALLKGLAPTPRGLAGAAFDGDDLDTMIKHMEFTPPGGGQRLGADPDEVPEPPGEPVTRRGDVWLLGDHRLVCGDIFDPPVMKALTGGKRAAAVLTDPPFAVYGSSTGVASDVADDSMIQPFFEAMWRVIAGHVTQYGHCYVHCDWRAWAAVWEGGKRARLTPKNMIVWDKGGSGLGNNYANTHELIAYFARIPPRTRMTGQGPAGQRLVLKPNVLRYDRPTGEARLHNAAKPVVMLGDLIVNATDEGQPVLDLFAGSGSVLIAAETVGRRCWAAEKEPQWCDVIVQRWQALTGGTANLETPENETDHDGPAEPTPNE